MKTQLSLAQQGRDDFPDRDLRDMRMYINFPVLLLAFSFSQVQLLWKKMPRSWKSLRHTAPAPKPGRLLTPVRKHKILLVYVQKKRGSYWSVLSLLLLYLYSVTQCLSLTLVFWTDLSNSVFSFCLSLLHSSLFGIALFYLEFLLFLFFSSIFVFSILHYNFLHIFWFAPPSHPASLIGFYDLPFVACHIMPPPPFCTVTPLFRPPFPSSAFATSPAKLGSPPTSLAGHWPDAQPRAGRRGPVLRGLTRPP